MSRERNEPDERVGTSGDTTLIADLVAECLSRREESGKPTDVADVCAAHPHLVDAVRSAVAQADGLERVHAAGMAHDPRIGQLLASRYELQARLGSGAMGVVYRATDLDLGREVAVKVLLDGLVRRDVAVARFEREATALASIHHPSVVAVHDRGATDDGVPFLVMELLEGTPLVDILERAPEEASNTHWLRTGFGIDGDLEASFIRQAVRWCLEVAEGLDAAHARGVVHRDVKPSNIVVRADGRAVLIDFGIALQEQDDRLTHSEGMVGTPAYLAPEAVIGSVERDEPRDVYGLAATLYHLLTLEPPYRGSTAEVLAAIATREPERASRIRPGLPTEAQALLDAGLARRPAERYPSMAALRGDLGALLELRPLSVRPLGPLRRGVRRARRSKSLRWAAAGVLVTTLLFVGRGLLTSRARAAESARELRHLDLWPQLPTNVAISDVAIRVLEDEGEVRRIRSVFDALVENGRDPLASLTLRAAWRYDQGEVEGATEDLAALAAQLDSDYIRALAARYAHGSAIVDLDGLPAPENACEKYVATVQLIRAATGPPEGRRDFRPALDALRTPAVLATTLHASELRFLVDVEGVLRAESTGRFREARAVARELLDRVSRFEESSGCTSATTRHVRAVCLATVGSWPDAFTLWDEALAEAPGSIPTLINASVSARNTGDWDRAIGYARAGLGQAPSYPRLWEALLDALRDSGRYREALLELDRSPFVGASSPSLADRGSVHRMKILVGEALALADETGGRAAAEANAKQALEIAVSTGLSGREVDESTGLARALLASDHEAVLQEIFEALARAPHSPVLVHYVRTHRTEIQDPPWADALLRWALVVTAQETEPVVPSPRTHPTRSSPAGR